jgi:hypothetical protein
MGLQGHDCRGYAKQSSTGLIVEELYRKELAIRLGRQAVQMAMDVWESCRTKGDDRGKQRKLRRRAHLANACADRFARLIPVIAPFAVSAFGTPSEDALRMYSPAI